MAYQINIANREISPRVINLFQFENGVTTLDFTLDSYMYDEVDLRNYKAYAITSINGIVDMTELEMVYDSTNDVLKLTWNVGDYTLTQEGAIVYQITFKENVDDGVGSAAWYSYKAIIVNRGSVDADHQIVAEYPTIMAQWLDKINELAGTLEAGIVYIPYGETVGTTERLAGRVYFQFTDSANTKGRFEDHEGKELNLSAYLPLSGGTVNGTITHNSASSEVFANKNTDDGRLLLLGGTKFANGGAIYVCGKDRSTSSGAVVLRASDGTTNKEFISKPDGTLTWDSKNIVRSVNNTQANTSGNVTLDVGVTSVNGKKGALTPADTGCLPLSGGTMTGNLKFNNGTISGASSVELITSANATNGGVIDFHYAGSTEDYTSRIIEHGNGALGVTAPNGLMVNGKNVVRSVDGTTADSGGNVVSNAVKLTGDQTIADKKTFTGEIIRSAPFSGGNTHSVKSIDTNGKGETSTISYYTGSSIYHRFYAKNTTSNKDAYIDITATDNGASAFTFSGSTTERYVNLQGSTKVRVPTPGSSAENSEAVNVGYLNNRLSNFISTTITYWE